MGGVAASFPPLTETQIEWLRRHFRPRCIGQGQDVVEAHRYAAKVELVDYLIRLSRPSKPQHGFNISVLNDLPLGEQP